LPNLKGPSWGPASKEAPKQLVILCHGVGADGSDLIDLAPFWARVLPDAVFAAPDGPEPFDMAPWRTKVPEERTRGPSALAMGI